MMAVAWTETGDEHSTDRVVKHRVDTCQSARASKTEAPQLVGTSFAGTVPADLPTIHLYGAVDRSRTYDLLITNRFCATFHNSSQRQASTTAPFRCRERL